MEQRYDWQVPKDEFRQPASHAQLSFARITFEKLISRFVLHHHPLPIVGRPRPICLHSVVRSAQEDSHQVSYYSQPQQLRMMEANY